ncbi:hypothetical protein AT15_07175 [Kosmotoga arenicorallina S304]|uniref:Uncharacterized protein n=1 Tax=Kosmotoga arenicorallina S304 TaxID=1453497 RepID=A0A182C7K7_9BACT|nr:hypothetical protein [Kosmotoga arenicorallina]OAA31270.1 hypothetical protein AT15_07175 [Kosmotoga arenicorallina S304]
MKKGLFFVVSALIILVFFGGCPASNRPYLSMIVQKLNREPGEVIEIAVNAVNFVPDGSEIYSWQAEYWDGDSWEPLAGHLFPQGSGQRAYLYFPEIEYEKLWISVKTTAFIDGELKEISGSRTLYFDDKPDVAVEVFEIAGSFPEPDSWFENWGAYKDERTPFYFRYVDGFSPAVVFGFDPFEGRIKAVEVAPNATPSESCVYIHGSEEILKSGYSTSDLDDFFNEINIGEEKWRRRIKITADLSSVGLDDLPDKWFVDLYPDASDTGYDPDNESLFLIRGVKTSGTFVADKLLDISDLVLSSAKTENLNLKSVITVHFELDEASLGIGPLLDKEHYFGIMLVAYVEAPASSEFTSEVVIEIPAIVGAEMVFSPDVDF